MISHHLIKNIFIAGLSILLLCCSFGRGSMIHGKNEATGGTMLDRKAIKTAVETWVRTWTPDARPDAKVVSLLPYEEDGEVCAYIARLAGSGFCLCGAHELVLPVYYYSPEGRYDPKSPGCRYLLSEIAARFKYLRDALARNDPKIAPYRKELKVRASDWSMLSRGRTPPSRPSGRQTPDPIMMELPLTCKWDQISPYNDDCPSLSPSPWNERVVLGCNATAMAQHLYYWQWPYQGAGQHAWSYQYRWRTIGSWDSEPLTVDPKIPANWPAGYVGECQYERLRFNGKNQQLEMTGYWDQSLFDAAYNLSKENAYRSALTTLWNRLTPAAFSDWVYPGSTIYDWSLMTDMHTDPVDPGDQEVAELCHHVSTTIESVWGIGGTCSDHDLQAAALVNHFWYDTDVHQIDIDPDAMVTEIQWLRTTGMGGSNADGGGHAWVIHGYDASFPNWFFLMNMGWGGNGDDWYTLDDVPKDLILNQKNLIHVAPLLVRFVGAADPGDGSPNDPYQNIEEAVAEAPDYSTLIFKAASYNTFAGSSLLIDKPMVLKGHGVLID
jgi:hypothetical protein